MQLVGTDKQLRFLFYSLWLFLLLIQCSLVGLSGDEAYYWRYSQQLAWGYFDHPPVTAVLIKLGYAPMPNELGVRFLFALLATAFIYAVERLIRPSNLRLYYAIVLSVAFLQIGIVWGGGMMALPDFPLLFFEAAFFLLYRQYLERPTLLVYVCIPVVVALMLLSKYHGIVVIGLVVLSNMRLLLKPSFWIMVVCAGGLLIPHVMWQVGNDFPSIKYHLFERNTNPYSINYTLEYIGSIPLIIGPIIGVILIYCAAKFRTTDLLERAMKFTAFGTYLFFLLMTFKGRVEGNWTIIALVPLLYLGYKAIEGTERLRRLTIVSFAISFPLILVARVIISAHITVPVLSEQIVPKSWTAELRKKTNAKPAVFTNSYQRAALYEFYEGVPSYSLNNLWGRKNQYTIWDTEERFQGKSVALVLNWEVTGHDSLWIEDDYYPYLTIDNFRTASNLRIGSNLIGPVRCAPLDTITTRVRFSFDPPGTRDLGANAQYKTEIAYCFIKDGVPQERGYSGTVISNNMVGVGDYSLKMVAPPGSGRYFLQLAAATGWLPLGINSDRVEFIVE